MEHFLLGYSPNQNVAPISSPTSATHLAPPFDPFSLKVEKDELTITSRYYVLIYSRNLAALL